MSRRPVLLALAVPVLLGLAAAAACACPVCFSGSERVRSAFLGTTLFLSLLPLGLIGAGLLWLRRAARGWFAGEFHERDAWPPADTVPPPEERGCAPSSPHSP